MQEHHHLLQPEYQGRLKPNGVCSEIEVEMVFEEVEKVSCRMEIKETVSVALWLKALRVLASEQGRCLMEEWSKALSVGAPV